MSTELSKSVGSPESCLDRETRQQRSVGLARDLSVIWMVACVVLCASCGYVLFLYGAFLSYAFNDDRPVPAPLVAFCVGAPLLLLVVMVVLGRLTSRTVAGWLGRRRSLEPVPVWVLAVVAMLAATAASAAAPAALFVALGER